MVKLIFANIYPERMNRLAGKPTNVKAKLWQGFAHMDLKNLKELEYIRYLRNLTIEEIDLIGHVNAKVHSFRGDTQNLYHPGVMFGFVDDDGNDIAPPMPCASTQACTIDYVATTGNWTRDIIVSVDGRVLKDFEVCELARNDGFDTAEDFFSWFDQDWQGKIIHWTDLKY